MNQLKKTRKNVLIIILVILDLKYEIMVFILIEFVHMFRASNLENKSLHQNRSNHKNIFCEILFWALNYKNLFYKILLQALSITKKIFCKIFLHTGTIAPAGSEEIREGHEKFLFSENSVLFILR